MLELLEPNDTLALLPSPSSLFPSLLPPPLMREDTTKQMIQATKRGDVVAILTLVEWDRDLIHARSNDGSTPLHYAAWRGHADIVLLLLELGADVNARGYDDHWGDTPLHAAACGDQSTVIEILLANGADLHARNAGGYTALAEAVTHHATEVASLLKQHGATM